MTSSSDSTQEKMHEKCVEEMVQSVLDGKTSIEELKATMEDCDDCPEPDNLEMIIKDCLKNKVEKKCCPEKIIQELKLKIGIATLVVIGLALNFKVFNEAFTI